MSDSPPISVAVVGSTQRTLVCLQALENDPKFSVDWVLTPQPREVGRKKTLTINPVHEHAMRQEIPSVLVASKIDARVQAEIETLCTQRPPYILLVVDFGYIIPAWLLKLPKIAPVNIHPSALPAWRGSSPGQFVLLSGEQQSAVTLMEMDAGLDSGPIISQLEFAVGQNWTQVEYYHHSFEVMGGRLADLLAEYCAGSLSAQAQPAASPTPIARRLSKDDSFVPWETLHALQSGAQTFEKLKLNPLLTEMWNYSTQATEMTPAKFIEQACRAFSPWPGLWTMVQTNKGEKRLKILEAAVSGNKLVLITVQLEGKQPIAWSQIKDSLKN